MIHTHKQQTLIENMTMWNNVIEEKLNQGLIESIDCVYADCYQHTGPGGFTGKGTEMLKQANQSVRSAFPDIHISNDIFDVKK